MKKLIAGLMLVGVVGMSAAYAADSQDASATDAKGLQGITIAEADTQQPAVQVDPSASASSKEAPKTLADMSGARDSSNMDADNKAMAKKVHHKKHKKHSKHHKHHKNKSQTNMQSAH